MIYNEKNGSILYSVPYIPCDSNYIIAGISIFSFKYLARFSVVAVHFWPIVDLGLEANVCT